MQVAVEERPQVRPKMTLFIDAKDLIRLRAGQVLPFTAPMGELGQECVLAMPGIDTAEHCVRIDAVLLDALEDGTMISLDPGLPIDAFARRANNVPARGAIERWFWRLFAAA